MRDSILSRILGSIRRSEETPALPLPALPPPPPPPLVLAQAEDFVRDPSTTCRSIWENLRHASDRGMKATQRTAWLLVSYDEAVAGTGHGQYLSDFGVAVAADTRAALTELRLVATREVLNEAIRRHMETPGETDFADSLSRFPPYTRPDYSDLHAAYLATRESVREAFFAFVVSHQTEFLVLEGRLRANR